MKFRNSVRHFAGKLLGTQNDMTLVWATNMPIIYVNNPKAGCSTMKTSLRMAQASMPHLSHLNTAETPNDQDGLLRHRGLRANASRERFVISCVRNPYTRALSGYLDKVHGRPYAEYRTLHHRPVGDFEDHLEALNGYTPDRMEPHLRPQHINLNFPSVHYDALFYLERLHFFQRFLERFAPGYAIDEYRPHTTSAGSKLPQYYTSRAIELARKIYRQDFELFGYDLDLDKTSSVPGDVMIGETPVTGINERLEGLLTTPRKRERFNALERTVFCHRLAELKII